MVPLAGSEILRPALLSPQISQVTILTSRKTTPESHPKLKTVILPSDDWPKGFDELSPSLMEAVRDHDACIWLVGVKQSEASKEDYIRSVSSTAQI